jgi:hypothetical protein
MHFFMIPYEFEGSYDFRGEKHLFTGELKLRDLEFLEGTFSDSSSRVPLQPIIGRMRELEGNLVMEFLKNPGKDSGLAPIQYQLTRPKDGEIEGDYEGAWRVAVDPKGCGQLGLGFDRAGEQVVIWLPEREIGNKARLRLREVR